MRTSDLIVPGRHDRERRVFHHTLDGFDATASVTSIIWSMDQQFVAAPAVVFTPNPGFAIPCIATHVFVDWLVAAHTVAGNWTLRLRKNEAAGDSATFAMVAGAPVAHQKVCGLWSQEVLFDACDTYHLVADGPEKNIVLARAILRFEELS
jgi:hypothetical protein